jgi:vancomycin resistance protein VanW
MLSAVRQALRRALPLPVRQAVALIRRGLSSCSETYARQAQSATSGNWLPICQVAQPIKQSQFWEGKLHNLQIGAARVDGVILASGQVLSLWSLLGRPTAKRGYAVGRAIRADVETGDVGGGLCQLSGLIYELGLRAGLEVVERHPHSRDLYGREEDRFTPLGLDATVVWPWKDLQLRNCHSQPLRLLCTVEGLELQGSFASLSPVNALELRVDRTDHPNGKAVMLWRGAERISDDFYR